MATSLSSKHGFVEIKTPLCQCVAYWNAGSRSALVCCTLCGHHDKAGKPCINVILWCMASQPCCALRNEALIGSLSQSRAAVHVALPVVKFESHKSAFICILAAICMCHADKRNAMLHVRDHRRRWL